MKRSSLVWLILLILPFAGLHSVHAYPLAATNLALNTGAFAASGDFVAFTVKESDVDLNGDGDMDDFVVHLFDATSGIITNIGLQTSGILVFRDEVLAMAVREADQGSTDLNGDGDVLDDVIHIYHAASNVTTNLSLGPRRIGFIDAVHGGRLISFGIHESVQGDTDLNGDGDSVDVVVHVYDTHSGTVTNIGLSAIIHPVSGNSVALAVRESDQGSTDLNGDGDTGDDVLHIYDAETGITTNFGVDIAFSSLLKTSESLIAFGADELGGDLNGDGDMMDRVVQVFDPRTKVTLNTGLACLSFSTAGDFVTFNVREVSQGNTDLNGDGDTFDDIVHIFDASSGVITNLGLAVSSSLSVSPNLVGIGVSEFFQGGDLNNDGDISDFVAHVYDTTLGVVHNLGFALGDPNDPPQAGLNFVAFTVSEAGQGNIDLNGDGDTTDRIGHVYDPVSGNFTNLGIALSRSLQLRNIDGDSILIHVGEPFGVDLNGDGDCTDAVPLVHDATLGTTTNLQLAVPIGSLAQDNHLIAVVVSEFNQGGTDLNGDGDANDFVLHVAGFPCGAGTVNSGMGPVADVLRLNGSIGRVNVTVGQPITASFDPAPMGPSPASCLLWIWAQGPSSPMTLSGLGQVLGCTSNPTPLHVGRNPQPFMCLRSPNLSGFVCQGVTEIPGPTMVPWSRTRATGFGQRRTFTIQGLVQDNGAANSLGYSVTNAVVLDVR